MFEIKHLLETDEIDVVFKGDDEPAAWAAFEAVKRVVSKISPRPKVALELSSDTEFMGSFDQTSVKEGG
jgi:hypothetical protein